MESLFCFFVVVR